MNSQNSSDLVRENSGIDICSDAEMQVISTNQTVETQSGDYNVSVTVSVNVGVSNQNISIENIGPKKIEGNLNEPIIKVLNQSVDNEDNGKVLEVSSKNINDEASSQDEEEKKQSKTFRKRYDYHDPIDVELLMAISKQSILILFWSLFAWFFIVRNDIYYGNIFLAFGYLFLAMWIVGLIFPQAVITFWWPNDRSSSSRIYTTFSSLCFAIAHAQYAHSIQVFILEFCVFLIIFGLIYPGGTLSGICGEEPSRFTSIFLWILIIIVTLSFGF